MNTQKNPETSIQTSKSKYPILIASVILLVVLALAVTIAVNFKVITVSGKGESYVLGAGKHQFGILYIEEGANAIFSEKSHWIGPVISKEGAVSIQNDVTITGPMVLFSNSLQLEENSSVDGNIALFAGDLSLMPGSVVRHSVVLFAGSAILKQGAYMRGDVVSFAGSVVLKEKAALRGDAILFAGSMQIGEEADAYGELIDFAGGLSLSPKAVLHRNAVLFSGDAHLSSEAQVKGDVILTAGNVTMDSHSRISGKLYLSPKCYRGCGNLSKPTDAQIMGGVYRPESIETIAGWNIADRMLLYLAVLLLLPVMFVGMLMAMMFYLGRRSRTRKGKVDVIVIPPQASTQPNTLGMS